MRDLKQVDIIFDRSVMFCGYVRTLSSSVRSKILIVCGAFFFSLAGGGIWRISLLMELGIPTSTISILPR